MICFHFIYNRLYHQKLESMKFKNFGSKLRGSSKNGMCSRMFCENWTKFINTNKVIKRFRNEYDRKY